MERLTLACGGVAVNSTEGLSREMLGWAGHVSIIGRVALRSENPAGEFAMPYALVVESEQGTYRTGFGSFMTV